MCHATNSEVTPYSGQAAQISVGGDGAIAFDGGHAGHTGPVYTPGLKDEHISWGDIIPSFEYVDHTGATQTYAGLNWPTGEGIWGAGCAVPVLTTAVAPTVVQSTECDVEGTYTIPPTTGVQYLLDGDEIAAGTYDGPASGTITAEALTGYVLTNPTFSFTLNVAAAADCYVPPPPPVDVCTNLDGVQSTVPAGYTEAGGICTAIVPPPPTDVCTNLDGVQSTVPAGYTESGGICTAIVPPPTDVCTNLDGVQAEVPEGYEEADGICTEVAVVVDVCTNLDGVQAEVPEGYEEADGVCAEIKGEETEKPKPTKPAEPKPAPQPPVEQPDEVLGTEAAVPTEVDAGLAGPAPSTGGSSPMGQAMTGAGLLLLVLAGAMRAGRRERGVHEA